MGAIQRVAGTLPLAFDPDYSPARGFLGPRWVTFGRSRVRESRTLGSVGAKAEWLSYPTTTTDGDRTRTTITAPGPGSVCGARRARRAAPQCRCDRLG